MNGMVNLIFCKPTSIGSEKYSAQAHRNCKHTCKAPGRVVLSNPRNSTRSGVLSAPKHSRTLLAWSKLLPGIADAILIWRVLAWNLHLI